MMDMYNPNNYNYTVTSYNNHNGAMNNSIYTTNTSNTMNNSSGLKRPLTLDLDKASSVIKKTRTGNTPMSSNNRLELLSSPDLHMLKLATPEIERLIMQQNITILSTPTSNGNTNVFFPKNVTEEQDLYVKGFIQEAMSRIPENINNGMNGNGNNNNNVEFHNDWGVVNRDQEPYSEDTEEDDDGNSMTSSSTSNYSHSNNNSSKVYPGSTISSVFDPIAGQYVTIKEEPGAQIVPTLGGGNEFHQHHQNPIDMESQEKIKLERKRMRNRVAASKCRRRKLERISKLEEKVKQIKIENYELNQVAEKLRETVKKLKSEVQQHTALGCSFGNSHYILNL